jgi:hypothetical protein
MEKQASTLACSSTINMLTDLITLTLSMFVYQRCGDQSLTFVWHCSVVNPSKHAVICFVDNLNDPP